MCKRLFLLLLVGGVTCAAGALPYHSADMNADNQINLSELLRVIQFYNSAALHTQADSEDGYAPGAGPQGTTPHRSDYNPQDWCIELSELLRLIQFFNASGYYGPVLSEDGFGVGAPENPWLVPVSQDTDGDLIKDDEESLIGYDLNIPDENQNGVLDGIDLALDLAAQIQRLYTAAEAGESTAEDLGIALTGAACQTNSPLTGAATTLQNLLITNTWREEYPVIFTIPGSLLPYLEQGAFRYQQFDADQCLWLETFTRISVSNLYIQLRATAEYMPSTHLHALENDRDGDYLTDAEEVAIGYNPDKADENENGVPDGLDLADAVVAAWEALPDCGYEGAYFYKSGAEKCGVRKSVGEKAAAERKAYLAESKVEMPCGFTMEVECYYYDPILGIADGDEEFYISNGAAMAYLFDDILLEVLRQQKSFSFYEVLYTQCTSYRMDVPFLYEALIAKTPLVPLSHLIYLEGDSDGDYLTDAEEAAIGTLPSNQDEDGNGVLDGFELAQEMAARIRALPRCAEGEIEKGASPPFFECGKKRALPPAASVERADPAADACAFILEYDCTISDPILGIEIAMDVYTLRRGEAEYTLDSITLRILESGSFSVYTADGPTWVSNRLPVALLHQILF